MAEFNSNGNQFGAASPTWNQNCASTNGSWNPNFSQPPPLFSVPPPPVPGSSQWLSGPRPSFCVPPPSFSGPPPPAPPPRFSSRPPPFAGPSPGFSGPPPSFEGRSAQGNGPPWSSPYNSSASTNPWCGAEAGQTGGKRTVNNVWSDPCFFSQNRRTFDGPQRPNRGWRGGRGAAGRGRGRGGHQFQQEHKKKNNRGDGYEDNNNYRHNNNYQHHNKSNNSKPSNCGKKEKIDKRDLPENNKYNCEVCDRGFKTEEKYEEHVSQHTQCWVAGCRYVAAPKLVQLHFYAQHKTGVAKKIWTLDNSEAVQKWIEDRKRNYPTKANIARKERERAEKRARGEVIENKQFGKMRGRGRGRRGGHWGRGQGGYHHEERSGPRDDEHEEKAVQLDGSTHTEGGQQTPASSLGIRGKEDNSQQNAAQETRAKKRKLDGDKEDDTWKEKAADSREPSSSNSEEGDSDSDDSDEDSDSNDSENSGEARAAQPQGDGLTSLIASYKDSTKEEGEITGEGASTAGQPEAGGDGGEGEAGGERSASPRQVVTAHVRAWREEPAWIRHNKPRRDQKHRNNTLLERLLVNEIRHERNVLLQCVHHIVKNNFLGVLHSKTEPVGQ